jgi:putative spermidine/putrescine transport system permease protein
LVTTVCCVLLGYPLAWWLHRLRPRARIYALALVVLPFWVSILVRCYAWIVLLGNAGLVNRMLLMLGIVTAPVSIIYNEFGIIVGTANLLLPYFVLPLVAAMMRIDRDLLRAAETMGASETQVFRAVFLPLTLPACAAGALLVFILTFGFYVTPALLGGGRVTMVANLLDLLINQMPDWELASAIATVLLALIVVVQAFASGLRRRTQ